jgi:hypothetical protein
VDHIPVPTGDFLQASLPMTRAPSVSLKASSPTVIPSSSCSVDGSATAMSAPGEDTPLACRPPADPPPVLAALACSVFAVQALLPAPMSGPDSPRTTFANGCLLDLLVQDCPSLPVSNTMPLATPVDSMPVDGSLSVYEGAPPFSSVTRVMAWPQMLGFRGDSSSYARMVKMAAVLVGTPPSLIDGGANICITGDINLLVDVVNIPPLPISVALHGILTLDDCCTARGLLPIQLDDGSVYWQTCYYSKNAVETIISPQAIVNSSDVF